MPKVNLQAIISPKTVGARAVTAGAASSSAPQPGDWYIWIGDPSENPPGPAPATTLFDDMCDVSAKGHGLSGHDDSGKHGQLHIIIGNY